MTVWAAVIGNPIEHSLSPVLHREAYRLAGLEWEYHRFQVDAEQLPLFLENLEPGCAGLSVTMPCKRAVVQNADVVDGLAKLVGAGNTLVPAAGMWGAFNTDVHGIVETVRTSAGKTLEETAASNRLQRSRAVILGTGATASSALAAVATLGYTEITVVGRNFEGPGSVTLAGNRLGVSFTAVKWQREDLLEQAMNAADLVISTVPADISAMAAAVWVPGKDQKLLDVTYGETSPLPGAFRAAEQTVLDPLAMLTYQGLAQVKLMSGKEVPFAPVYRAVVEAAR